MSLGLWSPVSPESILSIPTWPGWWWPSAPTQGEESSHFYDSLATLWTGWCKLAMTNKSKVPCSYFPSINYQGLWMSVLQSYLALVKLLELTGIVLDTVAIRAHSPVPAASSEEAQYREPTIDLIWNAVKSMEELLWIRCHTNASGSLGYKIKHR